VKGKEIFWKRRGKIWSHAIIGEGKNRKGGKSVGEKFDVRKGRKPLTGKGVGRRPCQHLQKRRGGGGGGGGVGNREGEAQEKESRGIETRPIYRKMQWGWGGGQVKKGERASEPQGSWHLRPQRHTSG